MASIEKTADRLNFRKDMTLLIIKPEPLEDGRKELIMLWLKEFCAKNCLEIASETRITIKPEYILAHYSGEKKLEEVGKKVKGSIRNASPDQQKKAEEAGLKDMPDAELGRMVKQIELDSYIGKESLALVILGKDALTKIRSVRGASDPTVSGSETIRGKFNSGMSIVDILLNNRPLDNIVHVPLNYDEMKNESMLLLGKEPEAFMKSILKEGGIKQILRK